jgi:protein-tyrosine phosphatase
VTVDRHLTWDGCWNVRDLGGLITADGRQIRRGAIVRSDSANRLTAAGWSTLLAHGVRTIVDLRDPTEQLPDSAPRSAELTTVCMPLEDRADAVFWERWRSLSGTPLYYRAFLERWPERFAAVFAAIAEAGPGGVLIHCAAGRDRTGLVTLLLLALAGVPPDEIAADYALSADRLRARWGHEGRPDEDLITQQHLRQANTSARETILSVLSSLDASAYLRAGGLRPDQEAAILRRLLGEPDDRPVVLP